MLNNLPYYSTALVEHKDLLLFLIYVSKFESPFLKLLELKLQQYFQNYDPKETANSFLIQIKNTFTNQSKYDIKVIALNVKYYYTLWITSMFLSVI